MRLVALLKRLRNYSEMIQAFSQTLNHPDCQNPERRELLLLVTDLLGERDRIVQTLKAERRRLMIFSSLSGLAGGDSDLRPESTRKDDPG